MSNVKTYDEDHKQVSQFWPHAEALRRRPPCKSLPRSLSDFIHASWVIFVRMYQHLFPVVRPRQATVFWNVLQRLYSVVVVVVVRARKVCRSLESVRLN